ncbi:MAG TPA: HAMP domain-containing sensor histidine kinase [Gemmataceae bacterium]|jgi:signal transduction histidine kinase|nr:HAMP domain-containing sensor histidine kinase [Gemmataceae bacterium]
MRSWFRGKRGGLIAFLLISGLVAGGLGWVTAAALRLEEEQRLARLRLEEEQQLARLQAEYNDRLRLALWRLDSRVSPVLARESSRPYNHYSAIFAPSVALRNDGQLCQPGTVLEPSPLLNADLPDWILLHFQTDDESGWASPEVLPERLQHRLSGTNAKGPFTNMTPGRARLLGELADHYPPKTLLASVRRRGLELTREGMALVPANTPSSDSKSSPQSKDVQAQSPTSDYFTRKDQQSRVMNEGNQAAQKDDNEVVMGNLLRNGTGWFSKNSVRPARSEQVAVSLSPMTPLWLARAGQPERLVVTRLVRIGRRQVCQGMLLDWPRLQKLLVGEVSDLFPEARMQPVHDEVPPHPERAMTALPLELDPGPALTDTSVTEAAPASILNAAPGWTPLRVGLVLAWTAALVALLAVGLGGWSLLDLSERRIRFVSAVTHELRTPLTTLRLYLDMLAVGMVKDEQQKSEYLQTLNAEADRLNRLVGNVLDFSRLENQRPRLVMTRIALADLLELLRSTWQGRCQDLGKELVIENSAGGDAVLVTDVQLAQQVLGNLVDNACKYSRGAEDRRIWLRALAAGPHRLVLEVEDRGPGVPLRERRSIFRPFRRGRGADVTAGGVGLGLALAQRWAQLLGGSLTLQSCPTRSGACFRFELPLG